MTSQFLFIKGVIFRNIFGYCRRKPCSRQDLKYSLKWESAASDEAIANVASVECVTIEENDTVLIKSPSGEIRKGSMYVYEREKKENDFVYVQDGRLLSADVRIYYKKAFLNADGQTYSYMDALALLDYPTCSLCMKD